MRFYKNFFLLIFPFLYFSYHIVAGADNEIELLLDFARFNPPPVPDFPNTRVDFTGIQALLNAAETEPQNSLSVPIHRVTSFAEAQPHIDELQDGDIWFSDVDQTLVDKECKLMEPGIVSRLENAKKRKVSVLALTAAPHPNKSKERALKKRNIRFSTSFSDLVTQDGRFSTLDEGILCSRGEEKGHTVERFLTKAYPSERKGLRNRRKVNRSHRTPPKRVLVMDNLKKNLLHINMVLQTLVVQPLFTEMQVKLIHYVPPRLGY